MADISKAVKPIVKVTSAGLCTFKCPTCGLKQVGTCVECNRKINYCWQCGQKFDTTWEAEHE